MYFEHGIHIQKLYLESAEQQGVLGYIARSAIDAILSGEQTDLSDAVFVYELTPGMRASVRRSAARVTRPPAAVLPGAAAALRR